MTSLKLETTLHLSLGQVVDLIEEALIRQGDAHYRVLEIDSVEDSSHLNFMGLKVTLNSGRPWEYDSSTTSSDKRGLLEKV